MSMIVGVLFVCTILNVVLMYMRYPEAKRSIETKLRFRKVGLPYREKWVTSDVAFFLIAAFGTFFGCVGLLMHLFAGG